MKKILTILLLVSTINFAQAVEAKEAIAADSIDLRAVVAKQIAAAIEKQTKAKLTPKPEEKPIVTEAKTTQNVAAGKQLEPVQAEAAPFFSVLTSLPLQYNVFALASVVIICFVFTRRIVLSFARSSKKTLKKKISLLREEKIGGSKENPKLVKARRSLKDNLEMLNKADGHVGKRAKQLNISKGELLLAARLKLFEVGKS
ncbi:MAG: hypothetical protein AB1394_14545 [Bacteroidota bacterium]